MVARVGSDAFGEGSLANFRADVVDAQHVRQDRERFSEVQPRPWYDSS